MGKNKRHHKRDQWKNPILDADGKPVEEPKIKGAGYLSIVKENAAFETFYKAQNIVPEGEWDAFMASLKENLPCTFRITGSKGQAKALLKNIEGDYFAKIVSNADEGIKFFNLPWYPEKLGWQVDISRQALRKTEAFARLHNFLISETATGNISRQEAVSMIPPCVLDVQPHHKVLDMCAAPGSKTSQLMELLHSNDTVVPDGVVIANDADNRRCYMLVHQVKRLQSPALLITNHDAGCMPNLTLDEGKPLKFDRILCDVPCSGDGTVRKNVDIWMKWNVAHSLNFHVMQARILKRGLELLDVGGMLAYSTCSLCPIEDESVIHHLLAMCQGSVELIDVSSKLPGLKYVPGLSTWKVMTRELNVVESPADIPLAKRTQIKDYMFPPSPEDAPKFNLQRCIRVLPHHQNTGGFFVAVLHKKSLLPWEHSNIRSAVSAKLNSESDATPIESTSDVNPTDVTSNDDGNKEGQEKDCHPPPLKKPKMMGYREDPFLYFKKDEAIWPEIGNVFGIGPEFDHTLILTRCAQGRKRALYFTNQMVKTILANNTPKLKIINTGIKILCRCDNKKATPTEFRLTQEGIETLLPNLTKRVVNITSDDVVYLLSTAFPVMNKLSQFAIPELIKYDNGSIALVCNKMDEESKNVDFRLVLCGWKGLNSLKAYVSGHEKLHYLRLCGVDTTKFEYTKFQNDGIKKECNDDADCLNAMEPNTECNDVVQPENNCNDIVQPENDCKDAAQFENNVKDAVKSELNCKDLVQSESDCIPVIKSEEEEPTNPMEITSIT